MLPPPPRSFNFSHQSEMLWREKQCSDEVAQREKNKNMELNEEMRMLRSHVATLED
jgi:hypothetical protein